MEKLLLEHKLSPGDVIAMTAAVRDLHISYPNQYQTDVETSMMEIWENNPYITKLDRNDPSVKHVHLDYPLVHDSNEGMHHFCYAFVWELAQVIGKPIKSTRLKGDIHISDSEKGWFSQVYEILGKDVPYWIIDAGCKNDYTNKLWATDRFQTVVEAFPKLWFVQVGAKDAGHMHPNLHGENVINLVGKTDARQFIRIMYHALGVITPVSFPMHLAAAVEVKYDYHRATRPCITIAGGREPTVWEQYTNHAYMHTCGMLDCCDNGGCWKSRIIPLGDGEGDKDESLCRHPVKLVTGQTIPQCMDMISANQIIQKVKDYMGFYNHLPEDKKKEFFTKFPDVAW